MISPLPPSASDPPPLIPPAEHSQPDVSETGLPGLRTWTAVYTAVTTIFAVWVLLLRLLTSTFS